MQLKLPIILGALFFLGHSLLVTALWRVSLRNIEFGAMWEHMRLTDMPVSVFLDSFITAYSKLFGATAYHKPYFLFHLFFGGIQFFVWGCLLGIVWNRLLHRIR
jgi:hypothetical protein